MKRKIVIIDGQGGKMGCAIIERLKEMQLGCEMFAIGTNSIATATMMKAGADYGATGENSVIVSCRDADVVVGPIGIVIADSLIGEITPPIALAVGQCRAPKLLIPVNRCGNFVVGMQTLSTSELIALAVRKIAEIIQDSCS